MAADVQENDKTRASDANLSAKAEENPAQNEVNKEQQSGNLQSGSAAYDEIKKNSSAFEKDRRLPAVTLDLDSKQELTSLSGMGAMKSKHCEESNPTISEGRLLPALDVVRAGLPVNEAYTSLSAIPVKNMDLNGQRTLVTAAHGMVNLKNGGGRYELLDRGFATVDTNGDGILGKDELKAQLDMLKAGDDSDPTAKSLAYQSNYVLENYDKISARSRELDPKSQGVSNEGLAQHYLEEAKILVQTPDGNSIRARIVTGNRDTDVAVLRTETLSYSEHASLGRNFEVSRSNPLVGDLVDSVGHAGGTLQAQARCFKPVQARGIVGSERANIMTGANQSMTAVPLGGMSGGPVLDTRRDHVLVGLNHAAFANRKGYFVPASSIQDELRKARSRP